jgi:hypothetical protein
MLFHITHTHAPELCPATNPAAVKKTWKHVFDIAKRNDVNIHGSYVDSPAHKVFLIAEADSASSIQELFVPVLTIGSAEIRPITSAQETIERFSKR